MDRHIDELERSCVALLADRASADAFLGQPDDVIKPLGLTSAEYREVMSRLERDGYIAEPAPNQAHDYRHFLLTPKLEEAGRVRDGGFDLLGRVERLFDAWPTLVWATFAIVGAGTFYSAYAFLSRSFG